MNSTYFILASSAVNFTCAIICLYYAVKIRKIYKNRRTIVTDYWTLNIRIARVLNNKSHDVETLREEIWKLLNTQCSACGKPLDVVKYDVESIIMCPDCFLGGKL